MAYSNFKLTILGLPVRSKAVWSTWKDDPNGRTRINKTLYPDSTGKLVANLDTDLYESYQFNLTSVSGISLQLSGFTTNWGIPISRDAVMSSFKNLSLFKKYGDKAPPGTYLEMSADSANRRDYTITLPTIDFADFMSDAIAWVRNYDYLDLLPLIDGVNKGEKSAVRSLALAFADSRVRNVYYTPIQATNLYVVEMDTDLKNVYVAASDGRGNPAAGSFIAFLDGQTVSVNNGKGAPYAYQKSDGTWHIAFVIQRGASILLFDKQNASKPYNVVYSDDGDKGLYASDWSVGQDPFNRAFVKSVQTSQQLDGANLQFAGTLAAFAAAAAGAAAAASYLFGSATSAAAASLARELAKQIAKAGRNNIDVTPTALQSLLIVISGTLGSKFSGTDKNTNYFNTMTSLTGIVDIMLDLMKREKLPRTVKLPSDQFAKFKNLFPKSNAFPKSNTTDIRAASGGKALLLNQVRSLIYGGLFYSIAIAFGRLIGELVGPSARVLNKGLPASYFVAPRIGGILYPWIGGSPKGTQVTDDNVTISFPIPGFFISSPIVVNGVKIPAAPVNLYLSYAISFSGTGISAPFKTDRFFGGLELDDNPFTGVLIKKVYQKYNIAKKAEKFLKWAEGSNTRSVKGKAISIFKGALEINKRLEGAVGFAISTRESKTSVIGYGGGGIGLGFNLSKKGEANPIVKAVLGDTARFGANAYFYHAFAVAPLTVTTRFTIKISDIIYKALGSQAYVDTVFYYFRKVGKLRNYADLVLGRQNYKTQAPRFVITDPFQSGRNMNLSVTIEAPARRLGGQLRFRHQNGSQFDIGFNITSARVSNGTRGGTKLEYRISDVRILKNKSIRGGPLPSLPRAKTPYKRGFHYYSNTTVNFIRSVKNQSNLSLSVIRSLKNFTIYYRLAGTKNPAKKFFLANLAGANAYKAFHFGRPNGKFLLASVSFQNKHGMKEEWVILIPPNVRNWLKADNPFNPLNKISENSITQIAANAPASTEVEGEPTDPTEQEANENENDNSDQELKTLIVTSQNRTYIDMGAEDHPDVIQAGASSIFIGLKNINNEDSYLQSIDAAGYIGIVLGFDQETVDLTGTALQGDITVLLDRPNFSFTGNSQDYKFFITAKDGSITLETEDPESQGSIFTIGTLDLGALVLSGFIPGMGKSVLDLSAVAGILSDTNLAALITASEDGTDTIVGLSDIATIILQGTDIDTLIASNFLTGRPILNWYDDADVITTEFQSIALSGIGRSINVLGRGNEYRAQAGSFLFMFGNESSGTNYFEMSGSATGAFVATSNSVTISLSDFSSKNRITSISADEFENLSLSSSSKIFDLSATRLIGDVTVVIDSEREIVTGSSTSGTKFAVIDSDASINLMSAQADMVGLRTIGIGSLCISGFQTGIGGDVLDISELIDFGLPLFRPSALLSSLTSNEDGDAVLALDKSGNEIVFKGVTKEKLSIQNFKLGGRFDQELFPDSYTPINFVRNNSTFISPWDTTILFVTGSGNVFDFRGAAAKVIANATLSRRSYNTYLTNDAECVVEAASNDGFIGINNFDEKSQFLSLSASDYSNVKLGILNTSRRFDLSDVNRVGDLAILVDQVGMNATGFKNGSQFDITSSLAVLTGAGATEALRGSDTYRFLNWSAGVITINDFDTEFGGDVLDLSDYAEQNDITDISDILGKAQTLVHGGTRISLSAAFSIDLNNVTVDSLSAQNFRI